MLLLAFHVIDVPGDSCHGHNRLFHHLAAPGARALRPVLAKLLPGSHQAPREGIDMRERGERQETDRGRGRGGDPEKGTNSRDRKWNQQALEAPAPTGVPVSRGLVLWPTLQMYHPDTPPRPPRTAPQGHS